MANYALSAILLLLIAYVMGCTIGCWLRGVSSREAARTTAPEVKSPKRAVGTVSTEPTPAATLMAETVSTEPTPAATVTAETASSEKPATMKPPTSRKPARRTSVKSKPAATDADDLKRIKGVGPVIERKLNDSGVRHFRQIAEWTPADVEEMDEALDFKGRIVRESWIAQAEALAKDDES